LLSSLLSFVTMSNDTTADKEKGGLLTMILRFLGIKKKKEMDQAESASPATPAAPPPARFFGLDVEAVYQHEDRLIQGLPLPVYYCALALKDHFHMEGIFRVTGTYSEMNKMKATFENGDVPDFTTIDNKHSLAGLLEMYFRELPEPVTTYARYNDFMAAAGESLDDEKRIQTLHKAIQTLPKNHVTAMSFFLHLLNQVASHSEENKMDERNLGVVFGQILVGTGFFSLSFADKKKMQEQSLVVQYLIHYCYDLFPEMLDEDHPFQAILKSQVVVADDDEEDVPDQEF